MSDLKTVTVVEKMANTILTDKAAKVSELTEKIKEEDALIKKAEAAMDSAIDSEDIKAYQSAKSEKQNAFDAKEMHEKMLKKINNESLLSKAEYKKLVSDIVGEVAALEAQSREQLMNLSDQMNAVGVELQNSIDHANRVIKTLQEDLSKEPGAILTRERIPYVAQGTMMWSQAGVTHYQYSVYVKNEAQCDNLPVGNLME